MIQTLEVPIDLTEWVNEFEIVMLESQVLEVPDALDALSWYTGLQQLARPFLGRKLEIWKTQFATEIQENVLSLRTIAQKIRYEIAMDKTLGKAIAGVKRRANQLSFPEGKKTK
jgi:hypothetical protein